MPAKDRALRATSSMLAHPVRAVLAYTLAQGVAVARIEAATGEDLIRLMAPGERLPEEAMPALLRLLAEERPGEAVALRMAGDVPLSVVGELLQVATLMGDAQQAVDAFCRFAPLLSSNLSIWQEPDIRGTRICLHHALDALDGGLGAELGVAMGARVFSEAFGFADALLEVTLAHAPNGPEADYAAFFPAPVRFGAPANSLLVRRAALGFTLNPASGRRLAQALRQLEAALEALQGPEQPPLLRAARSAVAACVADGLFGAGDVARRMGMSRRSLQRQLQAHDSSVKELLEEAREATAKELLAEGELPMLEVALVLGYSTEAALRRAFRRWTGESPGRWRRRHRAR